MRACAKRGQILKNKDEKPIGTPKQPQTSYNNRIQATNSDSHPDGQEERTVNRAQLLDTIGQDTGDQTKICENLQIVSKVGLSINVNHEEIAGSLAKPVSKISQQVFQDQQQQQIQQNAPSSPSKESTCYEWVHGSQFKTKKIVKMKGWQEWEPYYQPVSAIQSKIIAEMIILKQKVVSRTEQQ